MTIKSDLKDAALQIFNEFISVNIQAVYIQKTSTYVAGGSLAVTDVNHLIRVIRDNTKQSYDA